MPFGLKNAPANFQRFVYNIFRDLIDAKEVCVYIDDILIASRDLEDHIKTLRKVLRRIYEKNLELKLRKCKFCYNVVEYLGYRVTSSGIQPSESHIKAIANYPIPRNQKELRSCIGLFSYFRKFVPSFSKIAKPLLDLLRKDTEFSFSEYCLKAFRDLKETLVSAPLLAIYDRNRETQLHCDASSLGFGSVLLQKQDDGKFHPIAYFSKTTTPAESRYHSFELETLSIIYALRRFRIYLEGVPFKIITDCNSLTMTLNKNKLTPESPDGR